LLLALSRIVDSTDAPAPITYYALDLEERELERTLTQIANSDLGIALRGKVVTKGMWGTYEGGLKFIREGGVQHGMLLSDVTVTAPKTKNGFAEAVGDESPSFSASSASDATDQDSELSPLTTPDAVRLPLHVFFLGSSLGNFSRGEGADFLRSLPLIPGSGDTLLLGLDHDNEKELIELAYNDPKGYTRKFIMNGLTAAGKILGDERMFDEANWEYYNIYNTLERESVSPLLFCCLHHPPFPPDRPPRGVLQIEAYPKDYRSLQWRRNSVPGRRSDEDRSFLQSE
jgi:hypothetical protein